ncbi:hypothetical protein N2152v2_000808 [Parachlorella kessleri]
MELKDGSGIAQLALAVLFLSLLLRLLEVSLYRLKVPDTAARQAALGAEVAHLKRQAALLNHPDTFAQSAKADRKAIALERELAQLRGQQAAAQSQRVLKLPQGLRLALLAFLVARSWLGTSAVVAWIEPRHVWPLGRWLALLTGQPRGAGAVGLVPWALLCQRLAGALLSGR